MDEPSFSVRLFGPIEVLIDGQSLPRLRSRKALWLLTLLILRNGRPVQREWLSATLWPDVEQSAGLANLRTNLSELRTALGAEAGRLDTSDRHNLSLDIAGADVDLARFDEGIKRATLGHLMSAVELYQGPLLEGCSEEWVYQERGARERDCLSALEKLGKASLNEGDFSTAEKWYRRATFLDPWWDTARRGLMEALAKSGDVNEALQVYRSFDALLRSDSASVPDKQTTALYLRLRAEARQQNHADEQGPLTPPRIKGKLQHPITALVGREDERIEVAALLRTSRLITLTGFGGIGKTRLAVDVVTDVLREFPDGVCLVSLDSISEPRLLTKHLALALELAERPNTSSYEVIREYLDGKRILLVLDNCEHILDSVAELTDSILHDCSNVKMLATSREPLGIHGEHIWSVPPLAVPDLDHLPSGGATLLRVLMAYDGVRLFVERSRAVRKDFMLRADNAHLTAKICVALEGIPLAIEIAAARTNTMSLDRMYERLYDLIGSPGPGNRSSNPRHKTLNAVVDWSHELLSDAERVILRRLSIFSSGWTLEAAEKVCSGDIDSESVVNLLSALIQKGLVVFVENGGRYRLLEAVRQYADVRLEEAGESKATSQLHLNWCIAIAEEAGQFLFGPDAGIWVARLDAEQGNIRKALQWALTDKERGSDAKRLVASLWRFWVTEGNCREGQHYIDRILASGGAHSSELCQLLVAKGSLNYRAGNPSTAKEALLVAVEVAKEVDDKSVAAEALRVLGGIASDQADYRAAIEFFDESVRLAEAVGDLKTSAFSRLCKDLCQLQERDDTYQEVRERLVRGIEEFRDLGDLYSLKWALGKLGRFARFHGDFREAQTRLEEGLHINKKIGDKVGIAWASFHLGTLAESQADFCVAEARYEESLVLFKDHVGDSGSSWALLGLGNVATDQQDYDRARACYTECLLLFENTREATGRSHALIGLATICRICGQFDESYRQITRCLLTTQEQLESEAAAEALCEMASLVVTTNQYGVAVNLFAAANAVQRRLAYTPYAHDQERLDKEICSVRSALGEEAFRDAWEQGEAMSWDDAVTFALGTLFEAESITNVPILSEKRSATHAGWPKAAVSGNFL